MTVRVVDVVGRFRAGHQIGSHPAALNEWRITTGDPEVASRVHDLLGGESPRTWAAKGEDNLEVFTASSEVAIVIENAKALRERMVLWNRAGKPVYVSDGEYVLDDAGHPTEDKDPDADLSFAERKTKARDGFGAEPDIELYFRLAEDPDLGVFKFKTASWGFASDLAYNGVADALAAAEGATKAILKLEPVSFVAKNGPRKGQTVSYTKSELVLKGAVTMRGNR